MYYGTHAVLLGTNVKIYCFVAPTRQESAKSPHFHLKAKHTENVFAPTLARCNIVRRDDWPSAIGPAGQEKPPFSRGCVVTNHQGIQKNDLPPSPPSPHVPCPQDPLASSFDLQNFVTAVTASVSENSSNGGLANDGGDAGEKTPRQGVTEGDAVRSPCGGFEARPHGRSLSGGEREVGGGALLKGDLATRPRSGDGAWKAAHYVLEKGRLLVFVDRHHIKPKQVRHVVVVVVVGCGCDGGGDGGRWLCGTRRVCTYPRRRAGGGKWRWWLLCRRSWWWCCCYNLGCG